MRTGLHANQTRDHAKILDYYRRSGAKTFKTLTFDEALLGALKSLGVTIIGRVYEDKQRLGGDDARRFLNRVLDSASRHPQVDYWEGHNEAWHVPGEIERYAEREIERMKALEQIGKKAIIGNFATGTPNLDDASWSLFRPALEHAGAGQHALGLHEYAGPYMQYMVETGDGKNAWDHAARRWTGFSDARETYHRAGLEGWLTLRYRKVYRRYLAPWGIGELPLFITEGGIDNTSPRPGGQGAGWRDFEGSEYAKHPAAGDYAAQRRWYMWQVSHDRFVRGVVDFGWDGTATGWASFDLQDRPDMVNRIIAEEASLPVEHFNSAPAPAPAPQPADPFMAALATGGAPAAVDARASLPRHASSSFSRVPIEGLVGIAVHHSASPRDTTSEAIARFHVDTRGWAGIGYHVVIRRGVIHYVGDLGTARAHVAGRNHELVGICVTGDYSSEEPAAEDVAALKRVVAALDTRLGRQLPVRGHGEWAQTGHGTRCPGRLAGAIGAVRGGPAPASVPGGGGSAPAPEPVLAVDVAALWREADAHKVIRLNPGAALQRAILAARMVPTSGEWDHGSRYVAQRGESLAGGAAEVFVYDKQTGAVQRYKRAA